MLQGKQARVVGVRRCDLQVLQRRQQRQGAQSHLPNVRNSRINVLKATDFTVAWRACLVADTQLLSGISSRWRKGKQPEPPAHQRCSAEVEGCQCRQRPKPSDTQVAEFGVL